MTDTDLKHCPFCGAAMKYSQEPNDNFPVAGMYYMYHEGGPKNCPMHFGGHFDSFDEMADRWNTRADLSPVVKPGVIAEVVEDAFYDLDLIGSVFLSDEKAEEIERRILSTLSLTHVTPQQAAEVLQSDAMAKLVMAGSVTASVFSDYPSLKVVEEALDAIKGEGK